LYIDDDTFDARRANQRCVPDITRLFTKDRSQKLFFRCELCFSLRSDLSNKHIPRLNVSTDANDAGLIEILQEGFTDVGDVTGYFFRTQLGIACFDFKFFDVNRSVVIILNETLRNENRVFEVVTAPGHKRNEHVAPESEFPFFGARSIRQYLSLRDAIALS